MSLSLCNESFVFVDSSVDSFVLGTPSDDDRKIMGVMKTADILNGRQTI